MPRVLSSSVIVSQKSPRRGERFSRPKRSVLAASSLIQLGARIAEARFARAEGVELPEGEARAAKRSQEAERRPREAELCAGVAG